MLKKTCDWKEERERERERETRERREKERGERGEACGVASV